MPIEFKCDTCKNKTVYKTGYDEYPPFTSIDCCAKGYWIEDGVPSPEDVDYFKNCKEYELKIN